MELTSLYQHRFSDEERAAMNAVWQVLVEGYFRRWIPENAEVLDVGAGFCTFINHVRAARRVAFDVNPDNRTHCAPGVAFVTGPSLAAAQIEGKFDVAFLSNVLEHLDGPHAVIDTLAQVRAVLKPQGRAIILQPNFALVGARYFDFIDHKTVLTDRSLIEALELAGFTPEFVRRRFLPYTSKSRLPKWPWLVRLYLRLPPAQHVMGKQTLVVSRPNR